MSSRAPRSRALAEGGELRLVIPASCMVLRIFALTGIDQLIPNFADLDEALQPAPTAPSPPTRTNDQPRCLEGIISARSA